MEMGNEFFGKKGEKSSEEKPQPKEIPKPKPKQIAFHCEYCGWASSTMTTTAQDGPSPTPTTIQQDQVEAVIEGEVVSRQEAPRCIQVDHPPSTSI
jgi:hypothetical protein